MTIQSANPPTTKPISNHPGRKTRKEGVDIRPMEAIHHGWEALEALYRYRAMQPKHLARLLFLGRKDPKGKIRDAKAAQQAANRNCLYWLKNLDYVKTFYVAIDKGDDVKAMELHKLTKKGFQALNRHRKNQNQDPHQDYTDPKPVIIDQSFDRWLLGMEAAVSAEAEARLIGGKVTTYWDDYEIRQRSKRRQDGIDWGGLEPDALIIIEINGVKHAMLLEIDRGFQAVASNSPNSIRTKALKYREFFIRYRQYDPTLMDLKQPTVHFITKSKDRLSTIRSEIEEQKGRQSYWYSTFEWIQLPYSFLGEVWQVSGRGGYHSPITFFQP